ncbi:MAG TPA: hypothetical protein VL974_06445 [Magnetospirillum sp.]|nr:hypothetical protein [Magnetospirillum sp.]
MRRTIYDYPQVARAYLIGKGIAAARVTAVGRDYPVKIIKDEDAAALASLRMVRTDLTR